MNSIRQVLNNTNIGKNFFILLGDFLDEFYLASSEAKIKMISELPAGCGMDCKRELKAFAAATAHKLANDYKLDVPQWVFDKQYYLYDEPYFGCGVKGDMRLWFMYKSPAEFKHRNLFVDENVLSRV